MAGGTVEGGNMKKRVVALLMATLMGVFCMTGCGNSKETTVESSAEVGEKKTQTETEDVANTEKDGNADQKAADEVAALIDAIYV